MVTASSALLADYKVDELHAFVILVGPVVLQNRLGRPVARVDDVSDALRVLEPPPISVLTVEVKANVLFHYA